LACAIAANCANKTQARRFFLSVAGIGIHTQSADMDCPGLHGDRRAGHIALDTGARQHLDLLPRGDITLDLTGHHNNTGP